MSLANKYRPKTFDEMIGQEHIINILKAQMKARDTVHHNYLLFWPRGTWKTSSARLIAKGLNCLNLQDGNPCNECANCKMINDWSTIDYVEIDAASHTWVDNIREEIVDKIIYPPTALKKKIYVIDEVHMLSKGAFNALLKTIEEPKSDIAFILATTDIHKVLETIISRCQVFNYKKVPNEIMVQHLEEICKKENLQYTKEALDIIANISEGCVRDAIKYVDQVSILWNLNEENVSGFLWVVGEATIKELLSTIKTYDREEIFKQLDKINNHWIDFTQFTKQIIGYIDEHLLEDTDFLISCSDIFSDISYTIKWFPSPVLAYKVAVNKRLEKQGAVTPTEKPKKTTVVEKPVEKIEKKEEAKPEPEKVEIKEEPKEEKVPEEPKSEPETKPEKPTTSEWKISEENYPEIRQDVIANLGKPTVQSNLKDQTLIEKIENNEVEVIVISKIAEMLINNAENKKLIEEELSKKLGWPIILKITFEKKEDYFARKMWL